MKTRAMVSRRVLGVAVLTWMTLSSSSAFAGTSSGGGQLAQKATGLFQQFIDILTSPALTAFATIMFIMAIAAAYFGNMGEAFKGGLKIAAVTFGILSAASFMTQLVDAAGAIV